MSRLRNTLLNFTSKSFILILTNILSFVSRTIFINILGSSYLGVNGLLINILSMLSLTELGIGTAITFSLYEPLANDDRDKIKSLMNFYKNIYRVIGIIVFFLGITLMLFLDYIIPNPGDVEGLKVIFLIHVINSSISYFLSYKNTLLIADQREYKLTKYNAFFSIINILAQMLVLVLFKNYILYLVTNMIMLLIQRIYINNYISKMYSYIDDNNYSKLSKNELSKITKNVKAMLWHKIGDYCINGTDNIIISMFSSIISVGLYSNYYLVFNTVNSFIGMIYSSMTASVGNFLVDSNAQRKYELYKVIDFIGFWLYGFSAVCFYNLIDSFITLWIGSENLLSQSILLVLVINNYMLGMRIPLFTIKSAAGMYNEDKFVPIIQSIVNLVASVVLIQKLGLIGVFLGTLISGLIPSFYRPYMIYKGIFKVSPIKYYIEYIKNILILILATSITKIICSSLVFKLSILSFGIRTIICFIVPNLIFIIIFHKTKEFKYILNILNRFKKVKEVLSI